jgi:hypothetical protein
MNLRIGPTMLRTVATEMRSSSTRTAALITAMIVRSEPRRLHGSGGGGRRRNDWGSGLHSAAHARRFGFGFGGCGFALGCNPGGCRSGGSRIRGGGALARGFRHVACDA